MIYILTGHVRTGKTSALLSWCESRNDVDGVLCPDDENGKRYFLNIKSKETYSLETNTDIEEDNIISVGPFQFLKSSFQKANDYLLDVNDKRNYSYLVIDELGKLELKNEGLHDVVEKFIPNYISNKNKNLILVVRESLLETVVKHYSISEYLVLTKEDLGLLY